MTQFNSTQSKNQSGLKLSHY